MYLSTRPIRPGRQVGTWESWGEVENRASARHTRMVLPEWCHVPHCISPWPAEAYFFVMFDLVKKKRNAGATHHDFLPPSIAWPNCSSPSPVKWCMFKDSRLVASAGPDAAGWSRTRGVARFAEHSQRSRLRLLVKIAHIHGWSGSCSDPVVDVLQPALSGPA